MKSEFPYSSLIAQHVSKNRIKFWNSSSQTSNWNFDENYSLYLRQSCGAKKHLVPIKKPTVPKIGRLKCCKFQNIWASWNATPDLANVAWRDPQSIRWSMLKRRLDRTKRRSTLWYFDTAIKIPWIALIFGLIHQYLTKKINDACGVWILAFTWINAHSGMCSMLIEKMFVQLIFSDFNWINFSEGSRLKSSWMLCELKSTLCGECNYW